LAKPKWGEGVSQIFTPSPTPLILLITQRKDVHADSVEKELSRRGAAFHRLNMDGILDDVHLSAYIASAESTTSASLGDKGVNLGDVRSVWLRRLTAPHVNESIKRPAVASYIRDETAAFTAGLWESLDRSAWISPFNATVRAENKIFQLNTARDLGFVIPRTLVTTVPADARAFYDSCAGGVIVKAISRRYIEDERGSALLWTNAVSDEAMAFVDSVALSPTLFQERIKKHYELRITIVGRRIFACAIYSQEHASTELDWRHYDVDIPYRPISLPAAIEDLCLGFMRRLNLNFGAIDMVVTPDNDYVFLEVNPTGQWLWIEDKTGLRITDALVSLLVNGQSQASQQ
jgi:glutathione synthase/RimK-type ligase-like ATP-grasp enzyme